MQPHTPVLTQRGQLEAAASFRPFSKGEAAVAYSPIAHVLLMASGSASPRLTSNDFFATQQYEVGAGTYHSWRERWLLQATGGYGQADNHRRFHEISFLSPSPQVDYQGQYNKKFVQIGLVRLFPSESFSVTYRLSSVTYSQFVANGLVIDRPIQLYRHEPAFSYRINFHSARPQWQVIVTSGFSIANLPDYGEVSQYVYEIRQSNSPTLFVGVGVAYRPFNKH